MAITETVQRIEPSRLEDPSEAISNVVAEIAAAAAILARSSSTNRRAQATLKRRDDFKTLCRR